jgi:hypothetical protein
MPGRMPALLHRFQSVTTTIWARMGIKATGFWTTEIGASNQDLYYMLEWESLAEREVKWTAFNADPEWQSALEASLKDGVIVASVANTILRPTAFSVS